MTPAQPPLPTDWSLPFQPDSGSHASILISESIEGVNVAVTRQNAGRWLYCSPERGPPVSAPPGADGAKAPATTTFADVIFMFGAERVARLGSEFSRTLAAQFAVLL